MDELKYFFIGKHRCIYFCLLFTHRLWYWEVPLIQHWFHKNVIENERKRYQTVMMRRYTSQLTSVHTQEVLLWVGGGIKKFGSLKRRPPWRKSSFSFMTTIQTVILFMYWKSLEGINCQIPLWICSLLVTTLK